MDHDADRNEAVTSGFAAFAAGQPRSKVEGRTEEQRRLWRQGWDNAAQLAQQQRLLNGVLEEMRGDILALLVEGAALAKAYGAMFKASIRDKDRCKKHVKAVAKLEDALREAAE